MMNVNDQHFRSVGTFDRGYYIQWGRNPDSTERSDIFRISALDIHDINGKSWTYMKRLSGHLFLTCLIHYSLSTQLKDRKQRLEELFIKHFHRDFCTSHHLPQMDWHDRGAEVSEGGHGGDRHVGHLHQADCRRLHHALHEHRGEMTKKKTHSKKQVVTVNREKRVKRTTEREAKMTALSNCAPHLILMCGRWGSSTRRRLHRPPTHFPSSNHFLSR